MAISKIISESGLQLWDVISKSQLNIREQKVKSCLVAGNKFNLTSTKVWIIFMIIVSFNKHLSDWSQS